MLLSVHICDLDLRTAAKVFRRPPQPTEVPGLTYAETTITATLGGNLLPSPRFRRVALVGAWESDDAFEAFLDSHSLADQLSPGWQVRLQPLHVYGARPRLISTFSLWRDVEAMRAYARGHSDAAHPTATRADRANPFHHESAFIRFRPYASRGNWDGRDPLAAAA